MRIRDPTVPNPRRAAGMNMYAKDNLAAHAVGFARGVSCIESVS
jgi:hypothetical protein